MLQQFLDRRGGGAAKVPRYFPSGYFPAWPAYGYSLMTQVDDDDDSSRVRKFQLPNRRRDKSLKSNCANASNWAYSLRLPYITSTFIYH